MKSLKKIAVSFLLVLAMTCTMIGTFATETGTNEIISYTVKTSTDGNTWSDSLVITSESMIKVDVTLAKPGEVTLMSYKAGANTLDDTTIQYVTQETSGANNTASIKFRPRSTVSDGVYVIKIGAEGVSDAKTVEYAVGGSLNITAVYNNICYADPTVAQAAKEGVYYAEDVIYTIPDGKVFTDATIKIGDKELTVNDYIIPEGEANKLVIKPNAIVTDSTTKATLGNGSYVLSVTLSDKTTGYSTINVCPDVLYDKVKFAFIDPVETNDLYGKMRINYADKYTRVLCAPAIPDGNGGYLVSLKPEGSYYSTRDPRPYVVDVGSMFGYWTDEAGAKFNVEDGTNYIEYNENRDILTSNAVSGEQDGTKDTHIITKAGEQNIVYTKGDGSTQTAMRFFALLDLDQLPDATGTMTNDEKIARITKAGFVVSDLSLSPTIEAGFSYTIEEYAYESIKVRANADDVTSKNVKELATSLGLPENKYDCIITAVLDVDNTDYQRGKRIGAVPYIEINGVRTYGSAVSSPYSYNSANKITFSDPYKYQNPLEYKSAD